MRLHHGLHLTAVCHVSPFVFVMPHVLSCMLPLSGHVFPEVHGSAGGQPTRNICGVYSLCVAQSQTAGVLPYTRIHTHELGVSLVQSYTRGTIMSVSRWIQAP